MGMGIGNMGPAISDAVQQVAPAATDPNAMSGAIGGGGKGGFGAMPTPTPATDPNAISGAVGGGGKGGMIGNALQQTGNDFSGAGGKGGMLGNAISQVGQQPGQPTPQPGFGGKGGGISPAVIEAVNNAVNTASPMPSPVGKGGVAPTSQPMPNLGGKGGVPGNPGFPAPSTVPQTSPQMPVSSVLKGSIRPQQPAPRPMMPQPMPMPQPRLGGLGGLLRGQPTPAKAAVGQTNPNPGFPVNRGPSNNPMINPDSLR
jgi:hypothetical protein